MKKKIIIISVFSILILVTASVFLTGIIQSLNYDMYSNNEFDIGEGVFALILFFIGGFFVFYEIDLFYTVYYFL